MIDQSAADIAQRAAAAAANANFISAQYDAKQLAMSTLAGMLPSSTSGVGALPWAQFQQQRAATEKTVWDTTQKTAYLNWQSAVNTAYGTYNNLRSTAYY